MKRKLTLIVILALLISILIVPSTVNAATFGDYEYTDNGNGTCTITGYTGAEAQQVTRNIGHGGHQAK